jgi:hypothetical protein
MIYQVGKSAELKIVEWKLIQYLRLKNLCEKYLHSYIISIQGRKDVDNGVVATEAQVDIVRAAAYDDNGRDAGRLRRPDVDAGRQPQLQREEPAQGAAGEVARADR